MTQIKYIEDTEGNKIFPVTHEKAVRDSNGTTLESKLQMQTELINQAQMEIGAVPSDSTPVKNSTNWVLSGGLYSSSYIETEYFNIESSSVTTTDSTYQTITKTSTGFIITCVKTGAFKYAYCTIPNLTIGETYSLTFDFQLTNESPATYPYLLEVFTDSSRTTRLCASTLQDIGMSGSVTLELIPTTNTTTFVMANNNMGAVGCSVEISNVSVTQSEPIKNIVSKNTSELTQVSDDMDYITEEKVFGISDITSTGQTDSSIITCSIDNGIIKFVATGNRTSYKYAYFMLPVSLNNGSTYKAMFDYKANVNYEDGVMAFSTTTGQGGYGDGYAFRTGSGYGEFTFTMAGYVCVKVASNALNGTGDYIYISNFRVIKYDGESYDTLPQLTQKIKELDQNNIPQTAIKGYYVGNKIPSISQQNKIGCKRLMSNTASQGGAAYGNYYFQFTDHHASMSVYDLTTNTFHSTVSMTSVSSDHCTNACFSNIFYDNGDDFPLIYTSGSGTGTYNHIQVWRIQLSNNVFSISKVQEITLPTGTDENIWHWGQAFLDNELGYLWYLTYDKNSTIANYVKFNIPSIFDESDNVISATELTENDIIDSFATEKNSYPQGCVCKNGMLYLFQGVPGWGSLTKLYVLNIWGKTIVNIIDIYHILGITAEFEGCGIYNDTLIANTNGSGIYAIYF